MTILTETKLEEKSSKKTENSVSGLKEKKIFLADGPMLSDVPDLEGISEVEFELDRGRIKSQ